MIASDAGSFAVRTAMGVLLVSGHAEVWHLIALQACGGAAVAFYSPASYEARAGGGALIFGAVWLVASTLFVVRLPGIRDFAPEPAVESAPVAQAV